MFQKVSLSVALVLGVAATSGCGGPSEAEIDQQIRDGVALEVAKLNASASPAPATTEVPTQKTKTRVAQVADAENAFKRPGDSGIANPPPAPKPVKIVARTAPKIEFPVGNDHPEYWSNNPVQVAYRVEQDMADGDSFDH